MFDAIVLAGGTARRMPGADKLTLDVGGMSLLERALDAVTAAGRVVVVGPERTVGRAVMWRREEPVGGGPVAAIAAAIEDLRADVVVVIAADLPYIAAAIGPLIEAASDPAVAAACLADDSGRLNSLAGAWHTSALRAALAAIDDINGAPARALFRSGEIVAVPDPDGWGRDCDTWDDLAEARERAAQRQPKEPR
jgi:molybdopterin-guanine dinucleotide biosynthesis protein A